MRASERQAELQSLAEQSYDQLKGDWLTYYKVASHFTHKAQAQDRQDLLHTIIANLATMGQSDKHKPDNPSWMYRIASFTVAQYWRTYYKLTNGLDCGSCSKAQRRKCKEQDLYSECPRAIKIESLSKPIVDADGNTTELGELIADDHAIDLDAWLDDNTFRLGFPQRLLDIAEKIDNGEALNKKDQKYLERYRHKTQISLF